MVLAAVFKLKNGQIKRLPMQMLRAKGRPANAILQGYQVLHHKKTGMIGKPVDATKKPVSYHKALAIHTAIYMRQHNIPMRR